MQEAGRLFWKLRQRVGQEMVNVNPQLVGQAEVCSG